MGGKILKKKKKKEMQFLRHRNAKLGELWVASLFLLIKFKFMNYRSSARRALDVLTLNLRYYKPFI